ncbi:protein with unknown function [Dorcoceras hygrometricum]|uniref:Uncharacterized protein n=1 Tax=Dorcoceras hygrometricum TaxID=472368 RepID=A0A2Z7AKQ8_9LAMI|nr:protein with unknown function [Dorcoceras hygrometricum]
MSLFDLQDVCIAIGSIATLDLPMVVDLIGIYGLKGPYCTLTKTNWFLQGHTSTGLEIPARIPVELGEMSSVETIIMGYNQFQGQIPEEFGNLTNLMYLDLAVGTLSGQIPGELGKLKKLTTVYLYQNSFEGRIPPEIGNMTSLVYLDLSDNHFSGQIPYEVSGIKNLQLLNLMCNELTGPIPEGLGDLKKLEVLELWKNSLTATLPKGRPFRRVLVANKHEELRIFYPLYSCPVRESAISPFSGVYYPYPGVYYPVREFLISGIYYLDLLGDMLFARKFITSLVNPVPHWPLSPTCSALVSPVPHWPLSPTCSELKPSSALTPPRVALLPRNISCYEVYYHYLGVYCPTNGCGFPRNHKFTPRVPTTTLQSYTSILRLGLTVGDTPDAPITTSGPEDRAVRPKTQTHASSSGVVRGLTTTSGCFPRTTSRHDGESRLGYVFPI